MKDFSDILARNESSKKLGEYFAKICGKCGGMCCSYNISPISNYMPLSFVMSDENIIVLRKALILHRDFRKRFFRNLRSSLAYFRKRGFGKGLYNYIKRNKFSLLSIVKAYRRMCRRIDVHNEQVTREDIYDLEGRGINDCILLIPGRGCILEEYRPYTCVIAFRKCFRKLDLFDFVKSSILYANEKMLMEYLWHDFRLGEEARPKIIIGASNGFKKRVSKFTPEKRPAHFDELSYYQLTRLADFIVLPFHKIPDCMKGLIDIDIFYLMRSVKDPPLLTFVDRLYPGDRDNSFEFGLDYTQLFEISD